MQRWAVALVEVGRLADAAVARRRLGESLAGRRRPGRSPYGASLCMLLADVSARLGMLAAAADEAGAAYDALEAGQAREESRLEGALADARGRARRAGPVETGEPSVWE